MNAADTDIPIVKVKRPFDYESPLTWHYAFSAFLSEWIWKKLREENRFPSFDEPNGGINRIKSLTEWYYMTLTYNPSYAIHETEQSNEERANKSYIFFKWTLPCVGVTLPENPDEFRAGS